MRKRTVFISFFTSCTQPCPSDLSAHTHPVCACALAMSDVYAREITSGACADYRPIHTGRRRQRLSLTLNGVMSSVAELNCGSVASLHWRCSWQKLKTFQLFKRQRRRQPIRSPHANTQSHSCNTREACDWLL